MVPVRPRAGIHDPVTSALCNKSFTLKLQAVLQLTSWVVCQYGSSNYWVVRSVVPNSGNSIQVPAPSSYRQRLWAILYLWTSTYQLKTMIFEQPDRKMFSGLKIILSPKNNSINILRISCWSNWSCKPRPQVTFNLLFFSRVPKASQMQYHSNRNLCFWQGSAALPSLANHLLPWRLSIRHGRESHCLFCNINYCEVAILYFGAWEERAFLTFSPLPPRLPRHIHLPDCEEPGLLGDLSTVE